MGDKSLGNDAKRREVISGCISFVAERTRQREEVFAASTIPEGALVAREIDEVIVSVTSDGMKCLGCEELALEVQKLKQDKNRRHSEIMVRDTIQCKLGSLLELVQNELEKIDRWTDELVGNCDLKIMRHVYEKSIGSHVKPREFARVRYNDTHVAQLSEVMRKILGNLKLGMNDFNYLNEASYGIAKAVHSGVKDVSHLKDQITGLDFDETEKAKMMQALDIAGKIHSYYSVQN